MTAPTATAALDVTTPKPIPLVNLATQFASIEREVKAAIERVLSRCDFILGQDVREFEAEFAKYCGVTHALGVASGTDALHLACRAIDLGPGGEVIMPAMTFVATAFGVRYTGATPVLVDVGPSDALIDPDKIEAAITPRTKCLMPVHLFGQCADLDRLRVVAQRHGLPIIEDAAQAHGALHAGRRAGSFGELAAFSFYPGKNLGAYGDGGAVVTSDPILHDRLQLLRNFGSPSKYRHETLGYNSRLDTIQAAVLRVKLAMLDRWNGRRAEIAKRYDVLLADHPGIELTSYRDGSVYHLYVVRVADRDRVLNTLQAEGIGAGIHYPCALHELGAFADLGYSSGAFPVAEDWGRRCLSLPMDPSMSNEAIERCAAGLIAAVSST